MRPRPVRRRTAAARLGGAAPRTGPPPATMPTMAMRVASATASTVTMVVDAPRSLSVASRSSRRLAERRAAATPRVSSGTARSASAKTAKNPCDCMPGGGLKSMIVPPTTTRVRAVTTANATAGSATAAMPTVSGRVSMRRIVRNGMRPVPRGAGLGAAVEVSAVARVAASDGMESVPGARKPASCLAVMRGPPCRRGCGRRASGPCGRSGPRRLGRE